MKDTQFHDYVLLDVLSGISGITSRSMFGGYGIYKDGIIFGLIADDILYFKVDAMNKEQYQHFGSKPFTYEKGNHKQAVMSYWEVPEEIMNDREQVQQWVYSAVEASKRTKRKLRAT
jgi:DNA transformation protein